MWDQNIGLKKVISSKDQIIKELSLKLAETEAELKEIKSYSKFFLK